MRNRITSQALLFFFLLFTSSLLKAQSFTVSSIHPDDNFALGEQVRFKVTSNITASATYVINRGKYTDNLQTGNVNLNAGQTSEIVFNTQEPGNVFIQVKSGWTSSSAVAIVGLEEIKISEQAPNDFDIFWNGVKAKLQQVPISPQINPIGGNQYHNEFLVTLGSIEGRHVYGKMYVPKGTGPFPVVLELPAYGSGPVSGHAEIAERLNCIVLAISVHDAPVTGSAWNAYTPDNPANRNENYYKFGVIGGIRAIDYLVSRSDFNGDVAVIGESQGAGLGMIVAGIDSRVDLLAIASTAMCNHTGMLHSHASGFPFYLRLPLETGNTTEVENRRVETKYYDAAIAAKRFHGEVLTLTAYDDNVTIAETQFAANNNLDGKKITVHNLRGGHNDRPHFLEDQRMILRRHFSNTNNPPFPWASSAKGYGVDAGFDRTASANNPITLSAKIEKEATVNPGIPVAWRKVSGPGSVSFGSTNNYSTTASFSANGTYVLEFKGTDKALLNNEGVFYTLADRLVVTVGGGGGNPAPTAVLTTPSTQVNGAFQVTATFSENVNGLSLSDFNITNGSVSNLTGNGNTYQVTVQPSGSPVSIFLPANAVQDGGGALNTQSNTLIVQYSNVVNPAPTVVLTTVSNQVDGAFQVKVTFSESITGLTLSDFSITNCVVSNISGFGNTYTITVQPVANPIKIQLPANTVQDAGGALNTQSNVLSVQYNTNGGCGDISGFTKLGEFGGHGYYISNVKVKWLEAYNLASSNGHKLVSINTKEENEFIHSKVSEIAIIGLTDKDSEGSPNWASGEQVTFSNISSCGWCPSKNNINNFGFMTPWDGKWILDHGDRAGRYIIEVDCGGGTEPTGDCSEMTGYTKYGEFEGHGYYISQGFETWESAKTLAEATGGFLATINSKNENDYIQSKLNSELAFIGFNDANVEGVGQWANGENTSINFSTNNNWQNDFGVMNFWNGKWEMVNNKVRKKYIVEKSCASAGGGSGCGNVAGFTMIGDLNGHTYYLSNSEMTWEAAKANTISNGGYLVSIANIQENDFLQNKIGDNLVFIGYSDAQSEGYGTWANGEGVGFNKSFGNDWQNDYAVLNFWSGTWQMVNKMVSKRFVMEMDCNTQGYARNAEADSYKDIKIYPNPAQDEIFVKFDSEVEHLASVKIFDSRGQMVFQEIQNLLKGELLLRFDITDFPVGLYFIQIDRGAYERFVKMGY